MSQLNEPSLFTLDARAAQERLDEIFASVGAGSVYQVPLARALMLAEAAAHKASLEALQYPERRASLPPTAIFKGVEQLVELYFEGKPARIDLLAWDREGFIHGWSFAKGQPVDGDAVPYPSTVRVLASALKSLAAQLPDWSEILEQHTATLEGLLEASRTRALAIAAQRVERRRWWQRVPRNRAIAREMASLGFTGKAARAP